MCYANLTTEVSNSLAILFAYLFSFKQDGLKSQKNTKYFFNTVIYTQLRNLQRQKTELPHCYFDSDSMSLLHLQVLCCVTRLIKLYKTYLALHQPSICFCNIRKTSPFSKLSSSVFCAECVVVAT